MVQLCQGELIPNLADIPFGNGWRLLSLIKELLRLKESNDKDAVIAILGVQKFFAILF